MMPQSPDPEVVTETDIDARPGDYAAVTVPLPDELYFPGAPEGFVECDDPCCPDRITAARNLCGCW